MSNLNNNTTQLELLLQKINDLPEAGSGGTDTSDATAVASEIFAGETAYVADGKVTGTFTIENELTTQNDLISQITTLVTTKAAPSGTNTNDATATASDILSGKTAYVKGQKLTGTIATKTSSDLTASGATVTVPAGYYASQETKTISSGSTKTPATTVTKNPTISVSTSGLITASVSGTQSITPTVTTGYVSSGTAGTITVSGSATKQLTTKAAATITPGTSNQTITSGTYLTGTQTIKGDANLTAGNIKSGVSIFGVTGTYEGSSGGSTAAIETANVTLINTNMEDDYYVYGTWVDNNYISSYATDVYCDDSKVETVVKGSYITLDSAIVKSIEGDWSELGYESLARIIAIRNDCTITLK